VINFTYNNFIGNEQPSGTPGATRFYNNLCTRITVSKDLQFDLTTDYGTQKKDSVDASWMGAALIGKLQVSEKFAIAARGEYYKDEHQVILATGTADGFDGFGASLNTDIQLTPALLWRAEYRFLQCKSPVFPSKDGLSDKSSFIVTSLALSLQ
jgi:hypothetical protein